jgi:uncharacterized coiled-coil protein SlyX
MNPIDLDMRVGALEQSAARIEQRVDDLSTTVRTFAPTVVTIARIEEAMKSLYNDLHACSLSVDAVKTALAQDRNDRQQTEEERRKSARSESRSLRLALIGLSGVILAALITAVASLIAAGVL